MFKGDELKNHLETSSVIKSRSSIIGEWNMNIANNISLIGNYRYRPAETGTTYSTLPNTFDAGDSGNFYTGATDADILIDGGVDETETPFTLVQTKEKNKFLYSLEDCFKPFRPRSGINKSSFFAGKFFIHNPNMFMAQRPRYYMPDKTDVFKYWTSYRTESGYSYGVSSLHNNEYKISDSVPFIVYKDAVPTNRIVVKMQTNVGDINLGPFTNRGSSFVDPYYGDVNKTTPKKWKIQYLKNNSWVDAISFKPQDLRSDGSPIIKSDGYLEIEYGLKVPNQYKDIFVFAEKYSSANLLPAKSVNGYAYLITANETDIGTFHIWNQPNLRYDTFTPEYAWQIHEETVTRLTNFVTDVTSPLSFLNPTDSLTRYREFEYVKGLRVVVESMNTNQSTFDLIELSPRLAVDLTEKTLNYSVNKIASDLGSSGLPVGQLLASNGSVEFFDYDDAFNENNSTSIISKYNSRYIQIKFYEVIEEVNGWDYFVPLKTLYSDGFLANNNSSKTVSLELRDLYFYLESIKAPELLLKDISFSSAVSILMDAIGVSNYTFKRISGESEHIIPYFFVQPDISVAEVLQQLAISTQTAMFFDEYNNFILMSKEYMMPTATQRTTDMTLYGSSDQVKDGAIKNKTNKDKIANIIEISSQDSNIYNDGLINYTSRYIQRTLSSIDQTSQGEDNAKTWRYKPALLWEVGASENTQAQNEIAGTGSSYALSAIPLNSDLANSIPYVVNNQVVNNIIDLGEGISLLSRNNGYMYANGEIIKYDAVEYNIPGAERLLETVTANGQDIYTITVSLNSLGNVWVQNTEEYQRYFSQLPFNGKMYKTGRLRIYSEPNYEEINGVTKLKNGPVAKHGRRQFGTFATAHTAGLNPYWSDNKNVKGCTMRSEYLFGNQDVVTLTGVTSVGNVITASSTTLIKVGQRVKLTSGLSTGLLDLSVVNKVTEIVDATKFKISLPPQTALVNADLELQKLPTTVIGAAGVNNALAVKTTRNGIIKNFASSFKTAESENNKKTTPIRGTVQSSALVMNGPSFNTTEKPLDFISYVHRPLENKFKHFGTRMRIIGRIENDTNIVQTAVGSTINYTIDGTTPNESINVSGGGGGLGVLLNPTTNNGYYFEIIALGTNSRSKNLDANLNDVIFYKIKKDSVTDEAIPEILWQGLLGVTVDDGLLTGQYRIIGDSPPTVYDLSVEYENLGSKKVFYLFINENIIARVVDDEPLPEYNNMAMFVRGSSRVMFEHVYALTQNYSQNSGFALDTPVSSAFANKEINASESFRKYAISGIVQNSYLSGISSSDPLRYNIFFDEFGTIMREVASFNVKYNLAFPALFAKLSPTFNRIRGFVVSGFRAGAYGAEFLIFNTTDSVLFLDGTSGNYLKIQGVTFTQETKNTLTVDQYFSKNSSFSGLEFNGDNIVTSPLKLTKDYEDIKMSRMTYGKKDFSLEAEYIQTQDSANSLMKWIISKIMKPRKSVGVKLFATPTLQLGDIVNIDYNEKSINKLGDISNRYVVYNIQYSKGPDGPDMTVYLSEVA
jgi:hypothetical protein